MQIQPILGPYQPIFPQFRHSAPSFYKSWVRPWIQPLTWISLMWNYEPLWYSFQKISKGYPFHWPTTNTNPFHTTLAHKNHDKFTLNTYFFTLFLPINLILWSLSWSTSQCCQCWNPILFLVFFFARWWQHVWLEWPPWVSR